jgi:hypothetical protein
VEIGLKYANFAFEDKDLLLGGGLENGLPTGDDDKGIGSDEVSEVEPFLDFGWKGNRTELVGFISFGLPINGGDEEVDWELGW